VTRASIVIWNGGTPAALAAQTQLFTSWLLPNTSPTLQTPPTP
jgi:hypothetical protein